MSTDNIGTEFLENSGLLEMAEANQIVMLFPQVFEIEKILKGSLDLIQSPSRSVKIQIMGGKGVKAKHWRMLSTNF